MLTHRSVSRQHLQTFLAAKTVRPIHHPGGLVHDALVQACLDPEVLEVGYVDKAGPPQTEVDLGVITLLRQDGRHWLDVVPSRRLRSLDEHVRFESALRDLGLKPFTLNGDDILREPTFSSARAVWSHRSHRASFEMRLRIMRALADVVDMSLQELCATVPGPDSPILAVLSLACANALELDLRTHALGPNTRVRWRD